VLLFKSYFFENKAQPFIFKMKTNIDDLLQVNSSHIKSYKLGVNLLHLQREKNLICPNGFQIIGSTNINLASDMCHNASWRIQGKVFEKASTENKDPSKMKFIHTQPFGFELHTGQQVIACGAKFDSFQTHQTDLGMQTFQDAKKWRLVCAARNHDPEDFKDYEALFKKAEQMSLLQLGKLAEKTSQ